MDPANLDRVRAKAQRFRYAFRHSLLERVAKLRQDPMVEKAVELRAQRSKARGREEQVVASLSEKRRRARAENA